MAHSSPVGDIFIFRYVIRGLAKKWWDIGVRIEDDVLVTKDGYDVLSKDMPKTVDEIEMIMAGARAA